MAINSVLIDTNAYANFKKGNSEAIEIIKNVQNIIFCPIVLGELFSGFKIGSKESQNRKELEEFLELEKVICVYLDKNTSIEYSDIFKELKMQGKPIPTNDLWIAALAMQHNLPVFTYDKHFTLINGLKIITKLTEK